MKRNNEGSGELFNAFSKIDDKFTESAINPGAAASGTGKAKKAAPFRAAAVIVAVTLFAGLVTAVVFNMIPGLVANPPSGPAVTPVNGTGADTDNASAFTADASPVTTVPEPAPTDGPDSTSEPETDATRTETSEPLSETRPAIVTYTEPPSDSEPETVSVTEPATEPVTEPETTPVTTPVTESAVHVHSFSTDFLVSDSDYHYRVCKCGAVTGGEPHDYLGWMIEREPTPTIPGKRTKICRVCGQPYTEEFTEYEAVTEPETTPETTAPTGPEILSISKLTGVVWRYGCKNESGEDYPANLLFTVSRFPGKTFSVSRHQVVFGDRIIFGLGGTNLIHEVALTDLTGDSKPEIVIAYYYADNPDIIHYLIWDLVEEVSAIVHLTNSVTSAEYTRSDGARFCATGSKLYLVAAEKGSSVIPSTDSGAAYGEFRQAYQNQYYFQLRKGSSGSGDSQTDISGQAIILTFTPDGSGNGYTVSGRRKSSILEDNEILVSLPVLEIPSEFKGLPVTGIAAQGFIFGAFTSTSSRITKLVIPGTVKEIGAFSFSRWPSLEEVVIENGVETIGDEAFKDCTSLSKITLPASLRTIKGSAFANTGFTSVSIPDSVTVVERLAFAYCEKLESVGLPAGITEISEALFQFCGKLSSVTVPAGVKRIGDCAFWGCSSLTGLSFASGSPLPSDCIGLDAFRNCNPAAYPHSHEYVIFREDGVAGSEDECRCKICGAEGIPDDSYPVYTDPTPPHAGG